MALELNLTKNTNDTIQGTLGKYYARVEYKGTISIGDLAKHMAHHNTAFSKGIIGGSDNGGGNNGGGSSTGSDTGGGDDNGGGDNGGDGGDDY